MGPHIYLFIGTEFSQEILYRCPTCKRVMVRGKHILVIDIGNDQCYVLGKRRETCCNKEINIPAVFQKKGDALRFKQVTWDVIRRDHNCSSVILVPLDEYATIALNDPDGFKKYIKKLKLEKIN